MIISRPEIKKTPDGLIYQVRIRDSSLPDKLWYKVNNQYADFVSEASDAALAGLFIPAMQQGENIFVEGNVSEDLLFHINNDVQSIYGIYLPWLKKIRVEAVSLHREVAGSSNVAAGFSGGIDSFYTLATHFYEKDVLPGYRLTHLLYNNVGSHGGGRDRLCRQRYFRLKKLTKKLDLPFVVVDSNLDDFYKGFTFLQTHTPRDASVGLLLQNGLGKFLYSSSINYPHLDITPNRPITFSDSIILPKLSNQNLQLISVGGAVSRVRKAARVAEIEDSYEFLDVCVDETNEKNCSQCGKCLKTLLTLEAAGKLEKYQNVFDLETYRRVCNRFITSLYRSKSIHHQEIMAFAKEKGLDIPFKTRLYSIFRIYGLMRRLPFVKYPYQY